MDNLEITIDESIGVVKVATADDNVIREQSVSAVLLYQILQELKKINANLAPKVD